MKVNLKVQQLDYGVAELLLNSMEFEELVEKNIKNVNESFAQQLAIHYGPSLEKIVAAILESNGANAAATSALHFITADIKDASIVSNFLVSSFLGLK